MTNKTDEQVIERLNAVPVQNYLDHPDGPVAHGIRHACDNLKPGDQLKNGVVVGHLRWNGNALMLGNVYIGHVYWHKDIWEWDTPDNNGGASTEAEARAALIEAAMKALCGGGECAPICS